MFSLIYQREKNVLNVIVGNSINIINLLLVTYDPNDSSFPTSLYPATYCQTQDYDTIIFHHPNVSAGPVSSVPRDTLMSL